jgi:hypothetical protein
MNSARLPRTSLLSDPLWLCANFDDFQSPTGTTTDTKISGPTCGRNGTHSPNGKAIEYPAAALQDGNDPLTALEVSVLRLNHRQQLVTGCPSEVVRSCRQIHDPIFLRRSPCNEREFAEFITALGRWLYDGTNGVTSAPDRGVVTPTLPKWCYRDHRSVIVHVIVLRNHYLHGLSPNEITAEEHLTSAGDVFELYVAKRLPDDEEFAAIRVRMLAAATRLVDRLATHVPVRDAVDAEAVFANQNGDSRAEYFLCQIAR